MTIRIKLLNIFLCASLFFLSSCTLTKVLWGDKQYTENIEQFLVGADGRYVALVGTDYHYVFADNSGLFKEILSLNQQGILNIDLERTYLKLDKNNDIKGYITIRGPYSILPQQSKERLFSLGVKPDRDDYITAKIDLVGKRYLSKYLGHNTSRPTNTFYKISIHYRGDSSLTKDVGKAAITPIAVTLDAVLLIGKVIIYPLSL